MRKFIKDWEMFVKRDFEGSKYIDFKYAERYHSSIFNNCIEDKIVATFSDTLRDRWLNAKFNRFELMGRARNYKKYYNYVYQGVMTTKVRHVQIKNKSVKRLMRNNCGSFSFDNDLELPLSQACKLVGVYNGRYPRKYIKEVSEPDYIVRECLRRASKEFREFDDKHFIEVIPGSWQYNHINLRQMAIEPERQYSYEELLQGLKSRIGIDLVLPDIPAYDFEQIDNVRVNHTSFCGLNTSKLLGKNRNFSTKYTKTIAKQYARDIVSVPRNSYVLDTSLYHVGGRSKRIAIPYDKLSEFRSRATLCQEDVPTIIGQSLVVNINESLQKLAKGFNWGGRINGRGQFLEFIDNLKPIESDDINFNTDFSGHDNRVNAREMVVGMSFLRLCYPEGERIDRLFYYVLSSLVYKRIVSPESNMIYELNRGLPSGHSFTSILTTVTAYLKLSTAIHKVIPNKDLQKTHLQGAGDDWNGKMKKQYLREVHEELLKNSGAICDSFEENADSILSPLNSGKPTFLKKNYKNGLLAWNQMELFVNYSYPLSKKTNFKRFVDNCQVMCTSGPFDQELNTIMTNLIIIKILQAELKNYYDNMYNDGIKVNNLVESHLYKIIDLAGFTFKTRIDINHHLFDNLASYNDKGVLITTFQPRMIIREVLKSFNTSLRNSHKFMLATRVFNRFETVTRLKVFDTKKKYILSEGFYFERSMFHKVYLRSTRMLC